MLLWRMVSVFFGCITLETYQPLDNTLNRDVSEQSGNNESSSDGSSTPGLTESAIADSDRDTSNDDTVEREFP